MRYALLTHDYFKGKLLIPGLIDLSNPEFSMATSLEDSTQAQLDQAIEAYQYEYLSRLFSEKFAKEFIEGRNARHLPRLKGRLFLEAHRRLFTSVDELKLSPVAGYVYYWYMRDSKTTSTVFGEVDIDFTYGRNANNEIKLMDAWNSMADLTKPVYLWASSRRDKFQEAGYKIKPDRTLLEKLNRMGI